MTNQPPDQTNIHGNVKTKGGLFNTGTISVENGDVVGRDKNTSYITNNEFHYTIPLLAVTDQPTQDIYWLTAARTKELAKLTDWYQAAMTDRQGEQPRTVIVTGAVGMGKRELLQRWCADLAESTPKPLIAQTTYLPAYLDDEVQESYYRDHYRWGQAWQHYAPRLRTRYSTSAEALGGRGWLALMA